jgi:hypothetical protein
LDEDVELGQIYAYQVSANYEGGCESILSRAIRIKIDDPDEKPVNVSICTDEDDNALITWGEPNYSETPLSYKIYRDDVEIAEVLYGQTEYLDEDVEAEITYIYKVSAYYEGDLEFFADEISFTLGEKYCNAVKEVTAPTFKMYPNPTNGNVTISIDASSPYTLTVANVMGQVVTSMNGNTDRVNLNVANYAPGIYIVNIRTASAMTTQKLIVK